jgi:hypothetical protein
MARMRFSRRRLVLAAFATLSSVIAGTYHWRRLRRPHAGDIVALIENRLGHLDLDPAGVRRFAQEYDQRFGVFSMSVHHRDTLGGALRFDPIRQLLPERRQQAVLDLERRLVSYYLRSTDYFQAGRQGAIRFVAFPDPYAGACANPFAVLTP